MPDPGSTLKFKNLQKQQKVPYVIYADFESIIEKLPEGLKTKKKTEKTMRHIASGYAYTVVRSDGKSWRKSTGSGKTGTPTAAQDFLKSVVEEEKKIREELKTQAPLKMGADDWEKFNLATGCWICEKFLWVEDLLDSVVVRDPSTGKYCGESHRKCRWAGSNKVFGQETMAELQKRDEIDDLIEKWQEDCIFCGLNLRHKEK